MAQRIAIIGSTTSVGAPSFRDDELQAWERDFLVGGVIQGIGSNLAVVQHAAGANMSVDVGIGRALYQIANTNLTPNETYKVYHDNSAVYNVAIATADPTNPRIDIIVMKCSVASDPDASAANIASIVVVAGTPAGSPAAPATPANSLKLAQIAVAAGATSIVTGNITNSGTYVTVSSSVLADIARQADTTNILNNSPFYNTSTGSANAYLLTPVSNAPTAYVTGQRFSFKANFTNTGASTLNVNGLGAKAIKKADGATALIANDIYSGQIVTVEYDGTNMQMLSPVGTSAVQTTTVKTVYLGAASSTTLTNPTVDTAFDTHVYAIPANDLVSGVGYEFEFGLSYAIAAGSATISIALGSTDIASITINSGTLAHIRGFIAGTAAAGASVAVRAAMAIAHTTTTADQHGTYTAANVATNGGLTLQLSIIFNSSNGGNNATLTMGKITKVSTTPFS